MRALLLIPFAAALAQELPPVDPLAVEKRAITIMSDGTRMAGDLYLPAQRKPDEKLPAVVFCNGTGGTKKGSGARLGPIFAQHGYAFLAFDYRGWGESEPLLMPLEKVPAPDAQGAVTVKARAVRWQMNYADQTADIRAAIAWLAGEPGINAARIGIMGSSYGGGLVSWVGGHDPRVKCIAAQVPGMGGGRPPQAGQRAYELLSRQARGETEAIPFETGKLGGKLAAYAQMRVNPAKSIGFDAVASAETITAPTIIIVAENEELMNNGQNGEAVFATLKKRGVPAEYHVLAGITHYGVYREAFDEATKLELAWFDRHLKGASTPP